jgi:hypothetical protein
MVSKGTPAHLLWKGKIFIWAAFAQSVAIVIRQITLIIYIKQYIWRSQCIASYPGHPLMCLHFCEALESLKLHKH